MDDLCSVWNSQRTSGPRPANIWSGRENLSPLGLGVLHFLVANRNSQNNHWPKKLVYYRKWQCEHFLTEIDEKDTKVSLFYLIHLANSNSHENRTFSRDLCFFDEFLTRLLHIVSQKNSQNNPTLKKFAYRKRRHTYYLIQIEVKVSSYYLMYSSK